MAKAKFATGRLDALIQMPQAATLITAILGGTFDPVHKGHAEAGAWLMATGCFRRVHYVVNRQPPHRPSVASASHRLAMLQAALAEHASLVADETEMQRPGPSYMVDTLASFRAEDEMAPLALVIGEDALATLPHWHRWAELLQLAHIVVMARAGTGTSETKAVLDKLACPIVSSCKTLMATPCGTVCLAGQPLWEIKAHEIRKRLVQEDLLIDAWLAPEVQSYILKHRLYAKVHAEAAAQD